MEKKASFPDENGSGPWEGGGVSKQYQLKTAPTSITINYVFVQCKPKLPGKTKLVARLVFQGWQNCTGGIMLYKISELISYFMLLQSNGQCIYRKRLNFLECQNNQG